MDKLLKVQKELKAPKSQWNDYGKYHYRNAEDILEAAKPLCADNGLLLTISDDIVPVGNRYYIKATATVTDIEEGKTVSTTAYAREGETQKGMSESQITGSASSYARKYALNGLFCIDDTKDADTDEFRRQADNAPQTTNNKKSSGTKVSVSKQASPSDVKNFEEFLNGYGINHLEVCSYYKVNAFEEMTLDQIESCKNSIINKHGKKGE